MTLSSSAIKDRARAIGFDLCGIAPVGAFPELHALADWVARGYAGNMQYLARTRRRRADVRAVLPSTRSLIVLATLYNVDRPYSIERRDPAEALVSRYAWGRDYHDVLSQRMDALLAWLREASGRPFEARAYVDTGPVQERVYAQYGGLGWIGKNTCLINPEIGSWVFLSEILCSLELEADAPATDQCGTCTLCLEACPTGALIAPGVLDATRCISYWTIERKGPVPEVWRAALGRHVIGCDICQEVCPWNQHPPVSADPAWQPRPAFDAPRIDDLRRLDDAALGEALAGTAITRAGVAGLRRNLDIAAANSRSTSSPSVEG